jgi:hypothetical protein
MKDLVGPNMFFAWHMNERPVLASNKAALNVALWVDADAGAAMFDRK